MRENWIARARTSNAYSAYDESYTKSNNNNNNQNYDNKIAKQSHKMFSRTFVSLSFGG